MRTFILLLSFLCSCAVTGQIRISGYLRDAGTGSAITGGGIKAVVSGLQTRTDAGGRFVLELPGTDTLWISHIGYRGRHVAVDRAATGISIALDRNTGEIEEVRVSTGYYTVPPERATGSFVHVDNGALNRAMGGNILQRLEGMAPGVQFVQPEGGTASAIRVRGLSTIESDETPLIVLDNFPYEGDISNIDPNTIESITVLRDAAAASIWGARAGNGVIVITSKRATEGQRPAVSFNAGAGLAGRPDLTYGRAWLPSATVMAIEKERFGLGHYTFADNEGVSLYVDYLKQHADGILDDGELRDIEERLSGTDTRREAMDHLYRSSAYQQYALNIRGSSGRHRYTLNAGYHGSRSDVVGNDGKRTTLGLRHGFRPIDAVDIGLGLDYVGRRGSTDGIAYEGLSQGGLIAPYLQLQDGEGNAMAVPQAGLRPYYVAQAEENGLLDWLFRPLEERELRRNLSMSSELRLNTDVRAKLMTGMSFSLQYRYTRGNSRSEAHSLKDSYYVRDLVNTFTQSNGSQVIPFNGIYRNNPALENLSHFGRAQLDYAEELGGRHRFTALAGMEIRHAQTEQLPGSVLYNYEEEYLTGTAQFNFDESYPTRPAGTKRRIPGAVSNHRLYVHRDLSYFANGSYEFDKRYILSGSIRWDASNLFGVKTNQKGVPLWSVGGSWNISGERFYGLAEMLPYLRLRGTYGIAGNVNKTVTHYPTVLFGTSYTGLTSAMLRSIGNPSLRWEKVRTVNVGLDWRAPGGRISGSVEHYLKHGNDLIGDDYLDPTFGITDGYKINYADIKTRGWDVQLSTANLRGALSWKTDVLAQWVHNEVTDYRTNDNLLATGYLSGTVPPTVGKSRDVVYAIPWHGLSGGTGLPIIYMDGVQSDDYSRYFLEYLDRGMLHDVGSSVPTVYGSLRNTLGWKGVELTFMVGWKSGYVFRRTSMGSSDEYADRYHVDYLRRWERPGDEAWTDVPRHVPLADADTYRDASSIYMKSEALITRGDHIRLQDIGLSYRLPESLAGRLRIRNVRLQAYARNLGILWRSNGLGIDPDYANSLFRAPRGYSAGIQFNF